MKKRTKKLLLVGGLKAHPTFLLCAYLFAKKDRANIADDELDDFLTLARRYAILSEEQIARLLEDKDLVEICDGEEKQI